MFFIVLNDSKNVYVCKLEINVYINQSVRVKEVRNVLSEYDHELDFIAPVATQLKTSRAKNKGEKQFKKYLRNQASNYIKRIEVRNFVFRRDNYRCVQCGSSDKLEVDHIISVYRGGKNKICNLQTLCRSCNAGKLP